MTISTQDAKAVGYGNGSTTSFPFYFMVLDASHIKVVKTIGGLGIVDVDVPNDPSNFTVSGVGNPAGGSVDFVDPPDAGSMITIMRSVPFTQETDLQNQGAYYAETIEEALDLAVMRDQQIAEELSRTIKAPVGFQGFIPDDFLPAITRFSEVWLGAHAHDPSPENGFENVVMGMMYYNYVAGEYRCFDGASWRFHSGATTVDTYFWTATENQFEFSQVDETGKVVSLVSGSLVVSVNGIGPLREGSDYTLNANNDGIVLTQVCADGDEVQVVSFRQMSFLQVSEIVGADIERALAAVDAAEQAAAEAEQAVAGILPRNFATEAEFSAWIASGHVPVDGMTYFAGGRQFIGKTGSTSVTGFPGVIEITGALGGNSWASLKSPAIVDRSRPRFLMPENYIGLETQIVYAGSQADGYSGGTDFSPAFDAMRHEILSLQQTTLYPAYGFNPIAVALQPGQRYRVTKNVEFHSLPNLGLKIFGNGGVLCGDYDGGKAVLDCLGSRALAFRDLFIEGRATKKPSMAILVGRHVGDTAGYHHFDNVAIHGWYQKCGMYNYASEQLRCEKLRLYAYQVPSLWQDSCNTQNVSQYSSATVTSAINEPASFNNQLFTHCEFRTLGSGSADGAVILDGAPGTSTQFPRWWNMLGCYVTNGGPDGNTEARPMVRIRGAKFHRLNLDIHCEPRGNDTKIQHSNSILFDNSAEAMKLLEFRYHEHNSQAQIAAIDCVSNGQYNVVTIVGGDIAVLQRDGSFGGVDGKLFGANCGVIDYTGDFLVGEDALLNDFRPLKRFAGRITSEAMRTAIQVNTTDGPTINCANQCEQETMAQLSHSTPDSAVINITSCDVLKVFGNVVTNISLSNSGGTGRRMIYVHNARTAAITINNTEGGATTVPPNSIMPVLIFDNLYYAAK